MTSIKIVFPWGRYYAHPWGLNPVRLREAEWPPSPWRLLRALVSSWFRANPESAPSDEAGSLIQSLGSGLPEIGIGKIAFGQTVHYQPNYEGSDRDSAIYKNVRHENHFVALHGPVIFRWANITLAESQSKLLASLLADLSYLGRSESICHAEIATAEEIARLSEIGWCTPTKGRRISAQCRDVFCPNTSDFRIADLWIRRAEQANANSADAPRHLVDALLATDMKLEGARWISYIMPDDWPTKRVVRTPTTVNQRQQKLNKGPRIAKYMQFSLQCRVPLPPKFTVPLAEQFRRAACSHFSKALTGERSFALFGHAEDRPPDATAEHQHAFYIPTRSFHAEGTLDDPGMIADLHVWCPYGLTRVETQALLAVHRLAWKDGRYPVRPVLTAMSDEPPRDVPLAIGNLKSRIWRSETPFVPPRHFYRGNRLNPKLRESESPELQLIECLKKAGINAPGEVRRLGNSGLDRQSLTSVPPTPLWGIVRAPIEDEPIAGAVGTPIHSNGSEPDQADNQQSIGFFMELRFDTELALPMPTFGKSNHFGLGLFIPTAEGES